MTSRKAKRPSKKDVEIDSLAELKKSRKNFDDAEAKCNYFASQLSIFKSSSFKENVDKDENDLFGSPAIFPRITSSGIKSIKYKDFMNISRGKLERLIFKSFQLQFNNVYYSSSEDETNEPTKEPAPKKRRKAPKGRRSRKKRPSVPIGSGFYRFRPARMHNFNRRPEMPSCSEPDFDEPISHLHRDRTAESDADNLDSDQGVDDSPYDLSDD